MRFSQNTSGSKSKIVVLQIPDVSQDRPTQPERKKVNRGPTAVRRARGQSRSHSSGFLINQVVFFGLIGVLVALAVNATLQVGTHDSAQSANIDADPELTSPEELRQTKPEIQSLDWGKDQNAIALDPVVSKNLRNLISQEKEQASRFEQKKTDEPQSPNPLITAQRIDESATHTR